MEQLKGKTMRKQIRRLPNGDTTQSTKLYISAWKKLYRPLEKEFGWRLLSCDPDFTFAIDDNHIVYLPVAVVEQLLALIQQLEDYRTTRSVVPRKEIKP